MFNEIMCHEIRDCINDMRRETLRTQYWFILTPATGSSALVGEDGMEDTNLYAGVLPTLEMYDAIDRFQKPVIAAVVLRSVEAMFCRSCVILPSPKALFSGRLGR